MDKTFDAARAEAEILARWDEARAFRAGANAAPGAETFCIMIPPPNVTGSLHMGHAFNNTLQDILVRWHRMRGHDTLWQVGTDHAGIATQMVVERELAREGNVGRREMGRDAFVARVWQQKANSGGTIVEQLKRLGASCDWSREAFTMDEGFQKAVLKTFVDMYHHKDETGNPDPLIFRGKRLVNWDPHFETAISDLEVENVEVDGHMWHFKYPLAGGETYEHVERDANGNETLRETRDYISIATTRPETMLGDGAVAVHPSDARYAPIVGKLCEIPVGPKATRRMIPIITDEYPDPAFGSGAVKITGAHDFNDYGVAMRNGIPLYVLMDTRGAMRGDGLPYAEAAARAQAIAEGAPAPEDATEINLVPEEYRGHDRFEARKRVVADITAEGLAVMVRVPAPEPGPRSAEGSDEGIEAPDQVRGGAGDLVPLVEAKKIVQPFGDRSKVVIEPMLTDQWFVDTAKIVQPAIDAVRDGRTRILPEQDAKVYFNWLENIEPWCISRQLWWGHQVPVWYGPTLAWVEWIENLVALQKARQLELGRQVKFNEFDLYHSGRPSQNPFEKIEFCSTDDDQAVDLAKTVYGQEAEIVFQDDSRGNIKDECLGAPLSGRINGKRYVTLIRDPDVLDTWFSSGLWPIGTLGWPEETDELKRYFPTDVLVTGFDIIFFWVARMMMMQLEVVKEVPFRTVYVHALVRDEQGRKMSKSLGNALDPLDLIDEFGADAVRFTLTAMAAMGRDLRLSKDRIAGYRNFGTKLWNVARFAEMNDCHIDPDFDPRRLRLTANRWVVGEIGRLRESLDASLAAFRFNDAANALYACIWGRVCDWYVELAKPLFDGEGAAETRATMAWVLDQCLILLHPVMPFITEALWEQTGTRPKLLAHADWPAYGADLVDAEADAEMSWVIALIEQVRSVRAETHVTAGARVTLMTLRASEAQDAALERNRALIARLARIERFERAEAAPKGAVTLAQGGASFCLPLADVIDIAAERARLAKALDKLGKESSGLRTKLGNAQFLARAPEEVVAENRARLAALEGEAAVLAAAQSRLAALD